jgi:malic enzyme
VTASERLTELTKVLSDLADAATRGAMPLRGDDLRQEMLIINGAYAKGLDIVEALAAVVAAAENLGSVKDKAWAEQDSDALDAALAELRRVLGDNQEEQP